MGSSHLIFGNNDQRLISQLPAIAIRTIKQALAVVVVDSLNRREGFLNARRQNNVTSFKLLAAVSYQLKSRSLLYHGLDSHRVNFNRRVFSDLLLTNRSKLSRMHSITGNKTM